MVICFVNIQQRFLFFFFGSSWSQSYLVKTYLTLFPSFICNTLFKRDFMLYSVCHEPGKCNHILKIDESNYTQAILNRCYSSISSNKDLEPSQAMSSRACACRGWATVRNPHSSRMVSQRRLTTLELAGETQHKILLEIITLYGRYWLLLGTNRKLIDLLCRSNRVGGSSWAKPQKERSPSKIGILLYICHGLERILIIFWGQIQNNLKDTNMT